MAWRRYRKQRKRDFAIRFLKSAKTAIHDFVFLMMMMMIFLILRHSSPRDMYFVFLSVTVKHRRAPKFPSQFSPNHSLNIIMNASLYHSVCHHYCHHSFAPPAEARAAGRKCKIPKVQKDIVQIMSLNST